MQILIHEQCKLLSNAIFNRQPVKFILKHRRDMVEATKSTNVAGRGIQNCLQLTHDSGHCTEEQRIAIIHPAGGKGMNEQLGGIR